MKSTIDRLIINSPYEEPAHYWSYDREMRFFSLKEGRRPEMTINEGLDKEKQQ